MIEMSAGIICASMPACASIFQKPSPFSKTIRSFFSSSTRSKSTVASVSQQTLHKKETNSPKLPEGEAYYPYQGDYVELGEASVQ